MFARCGTMEFPTQLALFPSLLISKGLIRKVDAPACYQMLDASIKETGLWLSI